MDHSTQQLIDKFKRNPAIAQSLLQSGDGQRLMQMLTSQDGGAALNHAAQNAAAGKIFPNGDPGSIWGGIHFSVSLLRNPRKTQ